ncbi:MAG: type II secretion system protein GspD, partial [Planctomycetota bacterium]
MTLLSNPKILTLNRQRAKVFVGVKVGYLETTVVENQVLQTVKFIDSGIILDIRPYILRDGRIRLELSPKVSDVVFRQVEGQDGVVQQIPDERIQTVSTDVLVPAGYTAVIGGLFREDTTRSRKQVPLLGDIPLAGAAFRGHDDST